MLSSPVFQTNPLGNLSHKNFSHSIVSSHEASENSITQVKSPSEASTTKFTHSNKILNKKPPDQLCKLFLNTRRLPVIYTSSFSTKSSQPFTQAPSPQTESPSHLKVLHFPHRVHNQPHKLSDHKQSLQTAAQACSTQIESISQLHELLLNK